MKILNKQQGFTLVELLIVIVILGILAVTAAPRFLNLSQDANAAVLTAVEGSIRSANSIVYGKAVIAGNNLTVDSTVTVEPGVTVDTTLGYAKATSEDLLKLIDLPEGFTTWSDVAAEGLVEETITAATTGQTPAVEHVKTANRGVIRVGPSEAALATAAAPTVKCYLEYKAAHNTDGTGAPIVKPEITLEITGC